MNDMSRSIAKCCCTSDDRADQGCVARTIDQSDLQSIVDVTGQVRRHVGCKRREAEVECDTTLLTLRILIECVRARKSGSGVLSKRVVCIASSRYLAVVLSTLARLVFPESTCPRTPMLKLSIDI